MLKAYNRELKIELNPRAAKIRYLRIYLGGGKDSASDLI